MKNQLVKSALFYFAIYLVCWVVAYIVVNGNINIQLMAEYFVLGWSFQGMERPMFSWLISLVIFTPIATVMIFKNRKKKINAK